MAIHLLANLVRVDTDHKFEKIYDYFYQLISHESPVVAHHIAGHSGKIISARPDLGEKIIKILLTIDQLKNCRHKELIKSYVVLALNECFHHLSDQEEILTFVEKQLFSSSPKTKKMAKEFLVRYKHPAS